MDEIKLRISNSSTNMIYKSVLLRKFFCMMFIDTSGQKLDIFIATVFGGIKKDIQNTDDVYSLVQHDANNPCSLKFEFFSDSNRKLIENVVFNDKTQSFWDQTTCIERIWGKCTPYTDQTKVNELIKQTYPSLYPNGENAIVDVSKTIYHINQDDKSSHSCIVTQGEYKETRDTIKSKYMYSLSNQNTGEKIDGLEAMNWIHTEITLASNILNETVLFSIELDKDKIYTPDFTWYFAPPAGNIVSGESYARIGKTEENIEKNCIQSVSDETTVVFNEWRDPPLAIEERKKSRVLFKSAPVTDAMNLSKDEVLTVFLNITNPQIPPNRQFFIGLLVAFLLAFCSDKTRINDFYECIHGKCICNCKYIFNSINIFAPILLMFTFFVFILTPKKVFPPRITKYQSFFKVLRIVSLVSTSLLLLYVFGLWLVFPSVLREFINCDKNIIILAIGFLIAISSNVSYLIYCLKYLKRKIYNYL